MSSRKVELIGTAVGLIGTFPNTGQSSKFLLDQFQITVRSRMPDSFPTELTPAVAHTPVSLTSRLGRKVQTDGVDGTSRTLDPATKKKGACPYWNSTKGCVKKGNCAQEHRTSSTEGEKKFLAKWFDDHPTLTRDPKKA